MKKIIRCCSLFFLLLFLGSVKVDAASRNIRDYIGNATWYGTTNNGSLKQEVTSVTFDGNYLRLRGVMFNTHTQHYEGSGDHAYYVMFESSGGTLIYPGNVTGASRTKTHRDKAADGVHFTYQTSGGWAEKCSADLVKNSGAPCDVYYENVGFSFDIPLSELMDFASDSDISIYLVVHEKTTNSAYKDAMTTLNPQQYDRPYEDYLVTYKTGVNDARALVIEDYVFLRQLSGLGGDNTNDDQTCGGTPGIANEECNSVGRQFFLPWKYYRTLSYNNGKYCSGCYAGGTLADQQGAYQLMVTSANSSCDDERGRNMCLYDNGTSSGRGAWIAASAVRIEGQADIIRLKPNKKLWVDQIVSPTQECDGNAKLLVKAHCDPCSKDGSDDITISWGGKTKTVKLKNLPRSEQDALNGDGYIIKFDATSCAYNEYKQVHITAGNDDNPAGKLDSTGYIPAKDHMEMSCTNEDKMKQNVSNVVLTSKFRTPSLNRPDNNSQPWLYNETIHIRTGESPGTINAGMGFEYPVAYTYTVDKEVEKYGKLFPSGSFGFEPETKFYTTNLAQKLDEYPSYAKKDVAKDNPEKVANALKTVYSSKETPYTIPYKNSIPGKKEVIEEINNAILAKEPTSLSSTLFVEDYNGDGVINVVDSLFVQDLYSNSFVDGNMRYVLNSAQLPETYIEKGSGYVFAKKSQASVQPPEDGGNKVYTRLDTKQGDYYFSVSGQSIGLNQYSFVIPKCYYKVKCNPLAETCETGPECPPDDPECPPDEPECPPDDPECPPSTGQAVFRIISLKTPFPGREPGRNWVGHTNLIRADAYESSPEYSLDMNHSLLRRIQDYNSNYHYLNYNTFYWDSTSHIWRTSFIDKFGITRGV